MASQIAEASSACILNEFSREASSLQEGRIEIPGEADVRKLASLLSIHTPYDGSFELRIPGVHAIRISRTNLGLVHAIRKRFINPMLSLAVALRAR